MKFRIKDQSCKHLTLYFDPELREFYLAIPDLEQYVFFGHRVIKRISKFDYKGECEIEINKIELFEYKLLAKNSITKYVEVIK